MLENQEAGAVPSHSTPYRFCFPLCPSHEEHGRLGTDSSHQYEVADAGTPKLIAEDLQIRIGITLNVNPSRCFHSEHRHNPAVGYRSLLQ